MTDDVDDVFYQKSNLSEYANRRVDVDLIYLP